MSAAPRRTLSTLHNGARGLNLITKGRACPSVCNVHFAARFARFRALSFILDLEKPFFGASGGRGRAACSSFA